jgi:hypothetical protein
MIHAVLTLLLLTSLQNSIPICSSSHSHIPSTSPIPSNGHPPTKPNLKRKIPSGLFFSASPHHSYHCHSHYKNRSQINTSKSKNRSTAANRHFPSHSNFIRKFQNPQNCNVMYADRKLKKSHCKPPTSIQALWFHFVVIFPPWGSWQVQ